MFFMYAWLLIEAVNIHFIFNQSFGAKYSESETVSNYKRKYLEL